MGQIDISIRPQRHETRQSVFHHHELRSQFTLPSRALMWLGVPSLSLIFGLEAGFAVNGIKYNLPQRIILGSLRQTDHPATKSRSTSCGKAGT